MEEYQKCTMADKTYWLNVTDLFHMKEVRMIGVYGEEIILKYPTFKKPFPCSIFGFEAEYHPNKKVVKAKGFKTPEIQIRSLEDFKQINFWGIKREGLKKLITPIDKKYQPIIEDLLEQFAKERTVLEN